MAGDDTTDRDAGRRWPRPVRPFPPLTRIVAPALRGGSRTTSGGVAQLTYDPGRIAPAGSAWSAGRKPPAPEFTFDGEKYFVIADHFVPKGGDCSPHSRYQAPARSSETQRDSRGSVVNSFVDSVLAARSDANVVVHGDRLIETAR
ncbi:hypothetical protein ACFV5G_14085 [Streptomyces sp. NPDC059766]|uniref:hypothetical protein n=1 Tax=Streptomyces sp. NPDC059766 TaxID=3346940 RepID=UPI0036677C8C